MNIANFFRGILIGVANIIPGVSGGTIAVTLGIFDELIEAINNFFKDPKKYIKFLLPIFIGAIVGVLFFSSLIEYGLINFSLPTSMFFAGLVAGSIRLIYRKATEQQYKPTYYIYTLVAFIIVIILSNFSGPSLSITTTTFTTSLYIRLFISGAIAASAMIIPGISGSFVMILLGVYPLLISSISSIKDYLLDLSNTPLLISILQVVIPMGLGIVVGVLLISRIIDILFKKAYSITYFTILGLILGSLYGIFNDPSTYASGTSLPIIAVSIVTFAVGVALSLLLESKGK